jgi:hypothetical protein
MKFLFLRGEIPQDRNPQEIVFNTIEECDDVWTHLIFNMTQPEDQTELWYWGGKREHKFSNNFTERWVKDFSKYKNEFIPDVIFCRGGFKEYDVVLNRFPNAFKIYYGAGSRFLPRHKFKNYDLILQDSPQQLAESLKKFPNAQSSLFIKPAIDHMFKPIDCEKKFDIVFPANGKQESFKGHSFVFKNLPKKYSCLNLGNSGSLNPPSHIKRKRALKTNMPENLQRAKVGIVCCSASVDSCPRVIPEMLACNIPVVVFSETRFWQEKYITPETGVLSNPKNFWNDVDYVLNNLEKFKPRAYYDEHLSLKKAAHFLLDKISSIHGTK